MYRRNMGLCTEIFSKFSTPPPRGGETYKRKLEMATARNLREVHKFFFVKMCILKTTIFRKFFEIFLSDGSSLKIQKNCVFCVYFWNHGFYTKIDNEHFCFLWNFTPESVIKIFDLSQIHHTVGMGIWGLRGQNANEEFHAKTSITFGSSVSNYIKKYSTLTFQRFATPPPPAHSPITWK